MFIQSSSSSSSSVFFDNDDDGDDNDNILDCGEQYQLGIIVITIKYCCHYYHCHYQSDCESITFQCLYLWKTANQEPVVAQIRRRKWIWIGYTLRKPASNVTRQALTWNLQGKRKRGIPRVGLPTPSGSPPATSPGRL